VAIAARSAEVVERLTSSGYPVCEIGMTVVVRDAVSVVRVERDARSVRDPIGVRRIDRADGYIAGFVVCKTGFIAGDATVLSLLGDGTGSSM